MSKTVGIDLGTTNCAVAWAEQAEEGVVLQDFPVPQLTHPGTVEPRNTLPSYLYLPGPYELPQGSCELPWGDDLQGIADIDGPSVVGWLARDQGAKVPHRVASSAKSWLSHEAVDRHDAILPWKAPDDVPQLSPVEVSAALLSHIRHAWDQAFPEEPLSQQDVVLTVPASFDTVARELTAQAAGKAGLNSLTLLEEPQAAFYSWLLHSQEDWRKQVKAGDKILVCDIGGGTTDFSLIMVTDHEGDLELERVAVGDHILLGGDNMDLTLAVALQTRLKQERGIKLDSWQMQVLAHGCRVGKEQLLQEYADDDWPISIPGRGSSLIGGAVSAPLLRNEVEQVLLEGFFPKCAVTELSRKGRRVGLQELGLPFETDPAITRHLARFLTSHRAVQAQDAQTEDSSPSFLHPTAILFNGGVLKAPAVRERLLEVINSWLAGEGAEPVRVLQGADHDLAVCRGAARYGLVRQGCGIRIRGGTNRSYYIGIESSMPAIPGFEPPIRALCVAPFGMEEGSEVELKAQEFGLVVGEPVDFRFLGSTTRHKDEVGAFVDDWEEDITELASIGSTITCEDYAPGTVLPVRLQSRVTEVGTLELRCLQIGGSGKWKLEFEVREH